MVSKLVVERTGVTGAGALTADARAILDAYIADGRITHTESNMVDEVEHVSIFFQGASTLDAYIAEIQALGNFRDPGVTVLNIQRFDDI